MSRRYDQEAIETCRALYLKYGGRNFDAIQAGMRKAGYANWSLKMLNDRGRDGAKDKSGRLTFRFGWINQYGFDRSLKLHLEKLTENVNDDEQDLYIDIKAVRQRLGKVALGDKADKDDLAKYRDFCNLEIQARRNLNLSRDNFETFVSGFEKLCIWAPDIDKDLAKLLAKHGPKLAELAQAHYGKSEEIGDGAVAGKDEGGDGQASGLRLVK